MNRSGQIFSCAMEAARSGSPVWSIVAQPPEAIVNQRAMSWPSPTPLHPYATPTSVPPHPILITVQTKPTQTLPPTLSHARQGVTIHVHPENWTFIKLLILGFHNWDFFDHQMASTLHLHPASYQRWSSYWPKLRTKLFDPNITHLSPTPQTYYQCQSLVCHKYDKVHNSSNP